LKGNYGIMCEGGNIVNAVQEPEKRLRKIGVYRNIVMYRGYT
jgi:hypothetical protein